MDATVAIAEKELQDIFPESFGIAFDGWTEHAVHYLAVFAVGFESANGNGILLGFSPFEQPSDMSAAQHIEYIRAVMKKYNRSAANILYFVADNCNTNRKVANDIGIPLLGCSSHKLNLAVTKFLGDEENAISGRFENQERWRLLTIITNLMVKLKTIKGKAVLSEFTDYVALKPSETRWNGHYRMCRRFLQFYEALNKLTMENNEIGRTVAALMPSHIDLCKIMELDQQLTKIHSVSMLLQKKDGDVNHADVRILYDQLIEDFGQDFKEYLDMDAQIVNNKDFENGIVKVINGNAVLTEQECQALKRLRVEEVTDWQDVYSSSTNPAEYGKKMLEQARKRRRLNKSTYTDLSLIPISSNTVERFFSQVKLNLNNLRNSLLPSTLETIMFIKMNNALITASWVEKAMIHLRNNRSFLARKQGTTVTV
jgi:hAT family C-terminal dimerisation region